MTTINATAHPNPLPRSIALAWRWYAGQPWSVAAWYLIATVVAAPLWQLAGTALGYTLGLCGL